MKVAILGNMNNNGFAIMRYFRDLGVDAHLLPFANDGTGSLGHFTPEDDTWEIEKWRPYIDEWKIQNGTTAVIGWPKKFCPPPSKKNIVNRLAKYDTFIGSGISPALLDRIGRSLDIFYPYAMGIEWVGSLAFRKQLELSSYFRRMLLQYVQKKQIAGIRKTRICLNAEMGPTNQTFEEIGQGFQSLAIPMVYNREDLSNIQLPASLCDLSNRLSKFEFKVFSHARLFWVRDPSYSSAEWKRWSKHNDWLILGYAKFVEQFPYTSSALVLLEYGPDVDATKQLCAELGIEDRVLWLPKLARKEILWFLDFCDIGVGEFYSDRGVLWGGTGWEVLCLGKPLLQRFNFTEDEFREVYGHSPPPILDAYSIDAIKTHLIDMYLNKAKRAKIGRQSKEWFDTNNGIGLAKKWLDLLID